MNTIYEQILEDPTGFLLRYEISVDPELLRSKLRFIHQKISPGITKKRIRGILNMFTRWAAEKILSDLFELVQNADENKNKSLTIIKPELLSNEFLIKMNTGENEKFFKKSGDSKNITLRIKN